MNRSKPTKARGSFEHWLQKEPVKVQWAGFYSDTQELPKAGWQLSVTVADERVSVRAQLAELVLTGSIRYNPEAGFFQIYQSHIDLEAELIG